MQALRRHLLPFRDAALLSLTLIAAGAGRAADFSAWSHRQTLDLNHSGLVKLALPAETLDRARPDLADLRMVDGQGGEIPYAVLRPTAAAPSVVKPRSFRPELSEGATVLIVETGTDHALVAVTLVTSARAFVKPVEVALSADGSTWETVAHGVPVYRQSSEAQLTVALPRRPAAWVKLTLDDRRSAPVAFSGASLLVGQDRPAPTVEVPVRVRERIELARETVLTLDAGAAHLPLTAVSLLVPDRYFRRSVKLLVRDWQDGEVVERTLATGEIARFAIDESLGLQTERLSIPLAGVPLPSREWLLQIDNGDSPPLGAIEVRAERRPIHVVLSGPATTVYIGNPAATVPRYDLASLSGSMADLPVINLSPSEPASSTVEAGLSLFGPIGVNPDYRKPQPLAQILVDGAPLEARPWSGEKSIIVETTGIQRLEIDREVLAGARADLGDLRLSRQGRQVPYVIERSSRERELPLVVMVDNDPDRPRVGRWKVAIPKDLPITRLTLTSRQPLFQRFLQVMDTPADPRVSSRNRLLAAASWTRTPESVDRAFTLALGSPPQGEALLLEVDNGDNAPLVIDAAKAWYPAVHLLFRAEDTSPLTLHFGDRRLSAPHYDVSLVAAELLAAEASIARISETPGEPSDATVTSRSRALSKGFLFWGALGVVVVVLLVVISRLVPKPPSPGA